MNKNDWNTEFREFLREEEITPPKHLSDQILSTDMNELNPSPWFVFSKLALLHAFFGTLTLLFCPQFGISLFGGMGLMGLFMEYGEKACMVGCGALFLGSSALAASLLLKPGEVAVLKKKEILQISTLGLLSLGVFICTGSEVVFEMLFFWLLGSVLGGIATFELGWRIRTKIAPSLRRIRS
jgi:hypothetical protein